MNEYAKFINTIKFNSIIEDETMPSDEAIEEDNEDQKNKPKSGYDFSK